MALQRLLLFVLFTGLLSASPLQAQTLEEAEKLSAEGRAHYDAGDFKPALEAFKKAYKQFPSERYLFNAAKACIRLDNPEGAVFYYERYLAFNPVAADRTSISDEAGELKELLRKRQLKEVRLLSNPSSVTISIPGHNSEVISTPGSVFLPTGSYQAHFSHPDYETRVMDIEVTAQTPRQIVEAILTLRQDRTLLTLECQQEGASVFLGSRVLGKTPVPPETITPGEYRLLVSLAGFQSHEEKLIAKPGEPLNLSVALVPVSSTKQSGDEKGKDSRFPWRWVFLGASGAGVVLAATAGGLWYSGVEDMTAANNQQDRLPWSTYQRKYNQARDRYIAGQWLAVTGGVVGAAGLAGFLFWPRRAPPLKSIPAVTFTPLPGGGSFGFSETF